MDNQDNRDAMIENNQESTTEEVTTTATAEDQAPATMTVPNLSGTLTISEQLDALREAYTNGINDILDGCLATLILPQHQEEVAQDAAQFLIYILAVKITANNHQAPELKNLMQAYRHMIKRIEKEVPTMLLTFARELQKQTQGQPIN